MQAQKSGSIINDYWYKQWHHIALKGKLTDDGYKKPTQSKSRLFRGITSNHNADFYSLGCLHSFPTDNALKNMKYYRITTIFVK